MKNQVTSPSSSIDRHQQKAIQLASLIGDFLIDPKDTEMYAKLKKEGSLGDVQMMGQLRKGKERISAKIQNKLQANLQNKEAIHDTLEDLLNEERTEKEIDIIRKLYADPEVRAIYFDEFTKRKDSLDLLQRGYQQLGNIQKIDNIIDKARDKVLDIRVAAFAKNKKLSPSEIIYITKLQEGIEQKETEKGILLQTRETATAYRHQQIKTYKYQLDTEGFVITPSRQKIIDEIIEKVLLGQNVLLTGPTGTGKTVLAVQAVKTIATKLHIGLETIKGKSLALELQNNPDAYNILDQFVVVLSGHAGITPSEFIAKMGLKGDEKGGTQTYTQLGKVLKAFVDGNIPIIDEIDLIPNDVLMRIKHLFTLKPGKMYAPQEDGNQTHKLLTTTVIATANIKSAKHADRQEMDPAIVRLLPGTEVKYLPKEETYDLALANIIEPKGFAYGVSKESLSDEHGVLFLLIEALKEIEDNYLGKGQGITISNKSNMYLQKAILELGSFVALFKGFKESGKDFNQFIKTKIINFVSNGAYPKNDRLLLINIFSAKGLITKEDIPTVLERMSDISEGELDQNILKDTYAFTQNTMHFVDPYELANLDPYKIRNLETMELQDKQSVIRQKVKELSKEIGKIQDQDTEAILDILDDIITAFEKDRNHELAKEEIDQILGGLYELGLAEKLLECRNLGDNRQQRIEMIKLFDSKDKKGKKVFKDVVIPSQEHTIPNAKEKNETASSILPSAVSKQEQDANDYFTKNKEPKHLEVITEIQKLRDKKMITYKDTGNGTYEVQFNLPGNKMKRYMPPDTNIAESGYTYTLWDDTKITPQETKKNKLRSPEGQKYLEEKEKKEHKRLLTKEGILSLGKSLYPNGSEEEQILAIMIATGFYGYMWLADKTSEYQLAVSCSRTSAHRAFDKMFNANNKCSIIYTSTL